MGSGDGDGPSIDSVLDTAAKVKELIDGGGFKWTVISDPFSTDAHDCSTANCPFRRIDQEILLVYSYNWPIDAWHASELYARVIAEVDGCNVKNARVRPGSSSYVSWYSDRTYEITVNSVTVSNLTGASGCEPCCEESTCIDFDVSWTTEAWAGSDGTGSMIITVCGDGTVTAT